jgi:large subunit ribosomal protein L9
MEVILLETFDRLGQIGDIVKVKNGFARNFLIPNKKALRANKENKEKFLKIKNDLVEKNKKVIQESKVTIKKIEGKEILFIRNASDNGQLYGSVSPKDIANYFNEKNITIKPSNINLHSSIKKIGIYDLNVKLHAEVGCNLKINVATSEQNAKKQKEDLENEKNKSIELKKSNIDNVETKSEVTEKKSDGSSNIKEEKSSSDTDEAQPALEDENSSNPEK